MGENYKELLILNNSKDANLTLYIYSKHDPLCWLSFESKIIPPNSKHLHRSRKSFQFKLVARFEDKRPKTILETRTWVEDEAFEVTESLDCISRKLADYPQEKQIYLRNSQRDKELKITSGRRNLYEILGLNMKEVRKMKKEDQRKEIERGFREQMRIWHPEKPSGDDEIAKELVVAKELLLDEENRARYNNEADYDEGWLSRARYKAIFRPECFITEEEKKAYRKRMQMLLASALTAVIGIGITAATEGLANPAFIGTGPVFEGALVGTGLHSLPHTINKKAVMDECDAKERMLKGGIGLLCGSATGGIGVGMTAGMVGLGEKALSSAAVSTGQYIGIGAGTGAAGGALSSVASDAAKKFVDGEDVSLKQAVGHAACGAAIGAVSGVAVGAVSKGFAGKNTSAASSNIEGDMVEQIARAEIRKGGRRLGYAIPEGVSRKAAGTACQLVEERLDDSVENQRPFEHLKRGGTNYQPTEANEPIRSGDEECDASGYEPEQDQTENGKVKYISEGAWISKMIVNFTVDGVEKKEEVTGSGTFVVIPSRATQIEVRFQVRRPHWGDVMKYNRFERSWFEPREPHVFRYNTPPIRTFTISGNLWWEAVMCVTDKHHSETKET